MSGARWRKLRADLWLHRGRSALVIAAVAIALSGAGAVLNAWALVQRATAEGFAASLPVSAILVVDGLQTAWLDQLRRRPEFAAVRAQRQMLTRIRIDGRWQRALLTSRDDYSDQTLAKLSPQSGTWPPPPGTLVIERSSVDYAGATLGATALLNDAAGSAQPLTIAGVVGDVSLAPGWMENVVYAYLDAQTMATLSDQTGFDQLLLRVTEADADRAQISRVVAAAVDALEALGAEVRSVEVAEPGAHVHAAQMDSLLLTQAAFGVLCLLVCALLVVNLIAAVLVGQRRQIAIMKTLGAAPNQIAALYLSLALLLGLAASLLALPVALWAGHLYAQFKAEMLNFPNADWLPPWWVLGLQLAVGCALPVLAAALPVRRAVAEPVVDALRDVGIASGDRQAIPDWLAAWSRRGGRLFALTIGNALRRRQRLALTMLVLSSGGAVYLGAANLGQAVRGAVDLQFESMAFHLSLRVDGSQPDSALLQLAATHPAVAAAEVWHSERGLLIDHEVHHRKPLRVIGVPTDSRLLRPELVSGKWLDGGGGQQLVLTRALAANLGLSCLRLAEPCGSVRLQLDDRQSQWQIVGVIDTGPQSAAYVANRALTAITGRSSGDSLMVALQPSWRLAELAAVAELRATLAAAGVSVIRSQLLSESRKVVEDHLLMVVQFLGAMGWLMLLVGGIGLATTLSLNVLERTREIGVMRAIGASHGRLLAVVSAESLLIAVLAWALALPMSLPISVGLGYAFGAIMFKLPVVLFPGASALLSWLAVSLLLALVAAGWPARSALRVPVASAISYE